MRLLVPQPCHGGFLASLSLAMPEVEFVSEGTEAPWFWMPERLSFLGRPIVPADMDECDAVLGIVDTLASHPWLRHVERVVGRSYCVPLVRAPGPWRVMTYASGHVAGRSKWPAPVIYEARDPNVHRGWLGRPGPALVVAHRLYMDPERYRGCGGPTVEFLRRSGLPLHEVTSDVHISQDALVDAYRHAGCYLETAPPIEHCSYARPISGSLIEAMLTGTPVVARAANDLGMILTHDVDALLATSDEEILTFARALLADPDLARRIGAAGRETAMRLFSPAVVRAQWLPLFDRL